MCSFPKKEYVGASRAGTVYQHLVGSHHSNISHHPKSMRLANKMTVRGDTGEDTWWDKAVLVFAIIFLVPVLFCFFRAVELGYFHVRI